MTENIDQEQEIPLINQEELVILLQEMRLKQNLPLAILAGIISSLVGAAVWAAVTVATEYQIGWMAVGVGFLVGFSVRFLGKGINDIFGYVGAAFSLFGCLLGNFLSILGFVSIQEGVGYFEMFGMVDYSRIPEIMTYTFQPIDLLFYGLAIYQGYKFSFQKLSSEQISRLEN